jgi:hypothetical protein
LIRLTHVSLQYSSGIRMLLDPSTIVTVLTKSEGCNISCIDGQMYTVLEDFDTVETLLREHAMEFGPLYSKIREQILDDMTHWLSERR